METKEFISTFIEVAKEQITKDFFDKHLEYLKESKEVDFRMTQEFDRSCEFKPPKKFELKVKMTIEEV